MKEELQEDFMKIANSNHEKRKSELIEIEKRMRESEELNGRKVTSRKKSSAKGSVLVAYAALLLVGIMTVGYFNTRSEMMGKEVTEPRAGYVTQSIENISDPSFTEVVEEMFNGKGK